MFPSTSQLHKLERNMNMEVTCGSTRAVYYLTLKNLNHTCLIPFMAIMQKIMVKMHSMRDYRELICWCICSQCICKLKTYPLSTSRTPTFKCIFLSHGGHFRQLCFWLTRLELCLNVALLIMVYVEYCITRWAYLKSDI